jgi:hypothetical protein
MEDVLSVYQCAPDDAYPLVCMDESTQQLIGEVHAPQPGGLGRVERIDHEYVRNGVATLFLEVAPLAGQRHVQVTDRRTRCDWAEFVRGMVDQRYPRARKIRLVLDNLNTHSATSLYAAFPPAEARRLAERLEFHYTPKHGSWLNVAEIELSALKGQCLRHRIPSLEDMRSQVHSWEDDRNNRQSTIDWQFTTEDARIKLKHVYPKL